MEARVGTEDAKETAGEQASANQKNQSSSELSANDQPPRAVAARRAGLALTALEKGALQVGTCGAKSAEKAEGDGNTESEKYSEGQYRGLEGNRLGVRKRLGIESKEQSDAPRRGDNADYTGDKNKKNGFG